jgi:hypothetical protein
VTSGFVSGGIVAGCASGDPTFIGAVAIGAAAGGVGAVAGSVLEQGIDYGKVDPGKVIHDGVNGAAGGLLGAGLGKTIGGGIGSGALSVPTGRVPAVNLNGTLTYVLTHTDIQHKAIVMAGAMAAATQLTAQAARGLAMAASSGLNANDPAKDMAEREAEEVDPPRISGQPIRLGKFLEGDNVAEAAAHAKEVGKVTGVVDRAGSEARRAERLKKTPTVPGMDRDEVPPAAIRPDDPSKVSVKPINPSHNRRSGGILRGELPPDGTAVEIDP